MQPTMSFDVTPRDVGEAKARWRCAEAEAQARNSSLDAAKKRIDDFTTRLNRGQRRVWLLSCWKAKQTPWVIGAASAFGIPLLAGYIGAVISPSYGVLFGFQATCFVGIAIALWYYTGISLTEAWIANARAPLAEIGSQLHEAQAEEIYSERAALEALQRLEAARQEYEKLLRIIQCASYRLFHTDWRSLGGTEFEHYLAKVFRSLGYAVQITRATGDQGLDLIVSSDAGRIGVQAKGWGKKVGFSAVQEAHTGKTIYRCDRCAVITNSTYTKAAICGARQVGCMLFDGHDIPALIQGRIAI